MELTQKDVDFVKKIRDSRQKRNGTLCVGAERLGKADGF